MSRWGPGRALPPAERDVSDPGCRVGGRVELYLRPNATSSPLRAAWSCHRRSAASSNLATGAAEPEQCAGGSQLQLAADDLAGLDGLHLRLAADGDWRIRADSPRTLPGDSLLFRVREGLLGWSPGTRGLTARGGRFQQPVLPGPLDGAALGWRSESWSLQAVGGLRPGPVDLAVRTDSSAFGILGTVRRGSAAGGGLLWEGRLGARGERWTGGWQRQGLTVDNRFTGPGGLLLDQTAALDLVRQDVRGTNRGPTLADASLRARQRVGRGVELTVEGRHQELSLLPDEAAALPPAFAQALAGTTNDRAQAGVDLDYVPGRRLRAYGLWLRGVPRQDTLAGGGLTWERGPDSTGGLAWTFGADYAQGPHRRIELLADCSRPVGERGVLSAGLRTLALIPAGSAKPQVTHLGEVRLRGEHAARLEVGARLDVLLDQGADDENGSLLDAALLGQLVPRHRDSDQLLWWVPASAPAPARPARRPVATRSSTGHLRCVEVLDATWRW
ncbi:MAG: hypothetical protein RBU45_05125 [Myxococcota bacterium]|nr:hypothetical protein [Myxococcota bacterium]